MSERSISPYERLGVPVPPGDAYLIEHVFKAGETLSGLAHLYYGDWREWRRIADRNKVFDPRQIQPGTVLIIPDRPVEGGSFESL